MIRPCCVPAANSASRCSGCVLCVSVVKSRLSVSVTVRDGWWVNTAPTSSSSKYLPGMTPLSGLAGYSKRAMSSAA